MWQCPCWLNADVDIAEQYASLSSRCHSEGSRPPRGWQKAELQKWSPLLFHGEFIWRLGRCFPDNHILPTCQTDHWGPLTRAFRSLFSSWCKCTFLSIVFQHLLSKLIPHCCFSSLYLLALCLLSGFCRPRSVHLSVSLLAQPIFWMPDHTDLLDTQKPTVVYTHSILTAIAGSRPADVDLSYRFLYRLKWL